MAENLLADPAYKNAKPSAKPDELDAGHGLRLQARRDGTVWIVRYVFAGRDNTYTIGDYPERTLYDARVDAAAVRKLAALGVNPSTCTFEKWDEVRAKIQQGFPQRSA